MNILLLRGFNNYFNRIVKKYTTLADYKNNAASYLDFSGINFNPNDGVATELIIGSSTQLENNAALSWDSLGTPDYLVCYEASNNTITIKSRWFVLESERTRDGQYRIALKRDVLAEHFTDIMSAPCFVEKGIINNTSNPLLFNSEGGSYNQIKQNETLLKDATGVAWLVGYIKKSASVAQFTATMDSDLSMYTDYSSLSWKDCITLQNTSGTTILAATKTAVVDQPNILYYFTIYNSYYNVDHEQGNVSGNSASSTQLSYGGSARANTNYNGAQVCALTSSRHQMNADDSFTNDMNVINNLLTNNSSVRSAFNTLKSTTYNTIKTNNNLYSTSENLVSFDGTYIVKDNVLYKLSVIKSSALTDYSITFNFSGGTTGDQQARLFFNEVASAGQNLSVNTDNLSSAKFASKTSTYTYTIVAREVVPANALTIQLYGANNRNGLNDELFDMFAIPYSTTPVNFVDSNGTTRALDSAASMFVATQLMTKLGTSNPGATTGGNAYDLQLLPYCPLSLSALDISDLDVKSYYEVKTQDSTPQTFLVFPTSANFTRNITISKLNPLNALDLKVKNECDFYRLTSPNFNGMFEFKPSKLNGGLHYVNADCTYRPYSPYIKLNPDFSGLYGADFNDSTGLILGGDFSLSTLSDAWINYELNNKNYQAIFNRQIQSLDVNAQIAQEQLQFSNQMGILTGAIGGAVGGAATGAKLGWQGAVAGAAGGLIAGGLLAERGAQLNQDWLLRQQGEAKTYAIDMYNYQLGNIKALPQSITKTNPLTYNNKLWPILEEFSCTDAEKQMLRDKINYNGMTIMAVGTLGSYSASSDYSKVYVKGQLIRLEDVHDDFHIVDAIYQEVDKGFYIPQ